MDATTAIQARQIGAILVERNLITAAQLEQALDFQERTGARLGEIVVAEFGVSRLQLAGVLAEQWTATESPELSGHPRSDLWAPSAEHELPAAPETPRRRPIGEIFVELGFISDDQLAAALDVQRTTGARIGEILVEQGSLTRLDLASALAEHWESARLGAAAGGQPLQTGAPMVPRAEEAVSAVEIDAAIAELNLRLAVAEEHVESAPAGARKRRRRRRAGHVEEGSALAGHEAGVGGGIHRDPTGQSAALLQRLERVETRLDALAALEEKVAALATFGAELRVELDDLAGRQALADSGERLTELGQRTGGTANGGNGRLGELAEELRAISLDDRVPLSESEGCIAFAPTAAGYRLIELSGEPPEIGSTVELGVDVCEGPLVISRYGRSPLPFDLRPCAYLDRA